MHQSSQTPVPSWLRYGILSLLTLVAANLLAWRSIEPDLWGHIQYGEDWIHAGRMPTTASHTYVTSDQLWVNHENLFELAVASGQRLVGGLGLMVFKCVSGLWLLWMMVRNASRRSVPILAAAVDELARAFPKTKHILTDSDFETAAKHCVGLDGRRIRKLVISACALRKSTALDPNNLTASDLVQAARQAQEQASSIQEERR